MAKKTKLISLRVADETSERWKSLARDSGMTLSDWIKSQVDEKEVRGFRPKRPKPEVPKRHYTKADPELIRQLSWIGNNLNQLAKRANADGVDCFEMTEALLEIAGYLRDLRDAH